MQHKFPPSFNNKHLWLNGTILACHHKTVNVGGPGSIPGGCTFKLSFFDLSTVDWFVEIFIFEVCKFFFFSLFFIARVHENYTNNQLFLRSFSTYQVYLMPLYESKRVPIITCGGIGVVCCSIILAMICHASITENLEFMIS